MSETVHFPSQAGAPTTGTQRRESTHDHVWRRATFDIRTDVVRYECEDCRITWTGPRVSPWNERDGKHLRRG